MSMLVVEIFDRHLGDMMFQFGGIIIQMKPIHVCLILGIRVSHIANEFLFVDLKHMTNFRMRRCSLIKFVKNYTILSPLKQREKRWGERNYIEAPAIGTTPVIEPPVVSVLAAGVPAVSAPTIGNSSTATRIKATVVRVCFQLEEHGKMLLKLYDHGKMLQSHGKLLEQILIFSVRDNTLPLGDNLLLGQYQFSTPEKTVKYKREEEGNEIEDEKRKKAEPRTWQRNLQQKNQKIEEMKKGKGERQKKTNAIKKNKKTEEADVPLKKEDLTDEQLDHAPLIQLKTLIPKIPKKGLANRYPRKRQAKFPEVDEFQSTVENLLQQVTLGEGLEVVKDLVVDDDVEVGMEVNLEAILSKYGGGLLEVSPGKKGDKKDDEDEKDVEEKVKSAEEEKPQVAKDEKIEESKNGDEKVDDVEKDGEEKESEEEQSQVAKEEESEQPTVVVYYNGNKDVQHDNKTKESKEEVEQSKEEEDADEASQSVYLQTKENKKEVEQSKEDVVKGKDDDDENL
ncbi:hypothetical protein GIB67_033081 [Kingdonia uniflora]|uniref:Uncharacterized protein n=1 Tax=Kingdonia uniflora TaxID=39325 RepID=A0A7J7MYS2_9MAGN|nr:hypothetical protein GIB67_033081 [Kingdonia uniflora]